MNNPPDISQDPKEYEEYAHGIQKHVRGYLMVGALMLTFTAVTVALSYVDFGTRKANIGIAMLCSLFSQRCSRLGLAPGASGSISLRARRFILPEQSHRLWLQLR